MTAAQPSSVELALLALAEADRNTEERFDSIEQTLLRLYETIQTLLPPDSGAAVTPGLWWPRLDDDTRESFWSTLVVWLRDEFLPRRTDVAAVLTPCWHLHPVVVDDLTMLYATWLLAYRAPQPAPGAVAEWLDRWLPNARRRIEADVKECRRREHVAPSAAARGPLINDETLAWAGGLAPSSDGMPS